MISAFIEDGYTETRKFPASAGLYPEFSITFRPLTNTEQARWADRLEGKNTTDAKNITVEEYILPHLIDWSFEAERTAENINKLKSPVYDLIMNAIWSLTTHDAKN